MLIKFTITLRLEGHDVPPYDMPLYDVLINEVEIAGGQSSAVWQVYSVATGERIERGMLENTPRADHPERLGRLVAMVMRTAFPHVQENRYSEVRRVPYWDNPSNPEAQHP